MQQMVRVQNRDKNQQEKKVSYFSKHVTVNKDPSACHTASKLTWRDLCVICVLAGMTDAVGREYNGQQRVEPTQKESSEWVKAQWQEKSKQWTS